MINSELRLPFKMISPIQNISYKTINPSKLLKKTNSKPQRNLEKINFCSNVPFYGYNPQIYSFEDTLNKNYFHLPSIELDDGSIYQFQPDDVQIECAKKLYQGNNVILTAPTGTGKTAVAHYIITKNLLENKKTIYTTPIKALANDKLREFKKIYGEENVGLLTGDIKINTNAPIQIMTTEIYNNQSPSLQKNPKNVATVIFDEAHYLGDEERGNTWESSIVNTPFDKIQVLLLSATIGNANDVKDWISAISPQRTTSIVEQSPKERYVPLVYYIHHADYSKDSMAEGKFVPIKDGTVKLTGFQNYTQRQKRGLEIIYKMLNNKSDFCAVGDKELEETFISLSTTFKEAVYSTEEFKKLLSKTYPDIEKDKINEAVELLTVEESRTVKKIHYKKYKDDNFPALIEDLKRENMLPALIFALSRNQVQNICYDLMQSKTELTNDKEKEEILKTIEKYKKEGIYLGENFNENMLLSGFAYHHAGELPQYRKLIEELFSKKLLKTVIATSTLSAGINMPAKTTVITGTSYMKYNPVLEEAEAVEISVNDFHQMAGRAGRRGIDSIGNVILYNLKTPDYGFKELKAKSVEDMEKRKSKREMFEEKQADELQTAYNYIDSPSDKLRSQFKPDWHSLAQYYSENNNDSELKANIKTYFKYYLSKDKEKEERSMLAKFEAYKQVLLKQGFIEKNNRKEIALTPKGKILTMSQGLNPLVLANLIYDKKLKGLNVEEFCQILGYIAGSSSRVENDYLVNIVDMQIKEHLSHYPKSEEIIKSINSTRNLYKSVEDNVLRSQMESRIPPSDINISDSFSGFASYMWAFLNNRNSNSIFNYKKISEPKLNELPKEAKSQEAKDREGKKKQTDALKEYAIRASEGNVYLILSQIVSILNQINKICNYALSNPNDYPDADYWKELKENCELANLLMKQSPVWDENML